MTIATGVSKSPSLYSLITTKSDSPLRPFHTRRLPFGLVALALSLLSVEARAGYPFATEMPAVRDIAIEVEVDTNEALYVSTDNADPNNALEDEALADLNELKNAAFDFSQSVQLNLIAPELTEDSFAVLNGAYLQAADSFRYLHGFTLYPTLFQAVDQNLATLQNVYLEYPDERDPNSHIDLTVFYPTSYEYWYPYWRYPDAYYNRHLRSGYYPDPWNRYPHYREGDYRYNHRHRDGWDRHRDRDASWENQHRGDHGRPPLPGGHRDRPGRGGPGRGDPGHGGPGHGGPGRGDPGHGGPGRGDPGHGGPGRGDPGHGNPGHGDPGHGNPGRGDPGHGGPGRGDPGRGNPGRGDPGHGGSGHGNPNPGNPGGGHGNGGGGHGGGSGGGGHGGGGHGNGGGGNRGGGHGDGSGRHRIIDDANPVAGLSDSSSD